MTVQFFIHEGSLHQGLAVIKDTVHLNRCDVLAQRGELAFLNGADLALGIEHIHVDALDAQETVGHRRARVAAGGHEHVDRRVGRGSPATISQEVLQQAGHKPSTYILEGQGGAVEQFQRVDVLLHLHDGTVELQRVVYQILQTVQVNVFAEEGAGYVVGDVLETHRRHVVEEGLRQLVNLFGHVEPAVLGQSLDDGLLQIGLWGLMVGAVVFHLYSE